MITLISFTLFITVIYPDDVNVDWQPTSGDEIWRAYLMEYGNFLTARSSKMAASLICGETVSRVSSVLNRDVKQFGKKYMFDSSEETCWNSDQGPSQWVLLHFPRPGRVSTVILQFQGGFSAKTCRLEGCLTEGAFVKITDFYPEDNSSSQSFPIEGSPVVDKLKIVFENSADFFGRIVVYSLNVLGERAL